MLVLVFLTFLGVIYYQISNYLFFLFFVDLLFIFKIFLLNKKNQNILLFLNATSNTYIFLYILILNKNKILKNK